jgi:hypothetical protein
MQYTHHSLASLCSEYAYRDLWGTHLHGGTTTPHNINNGNKRVMTQSASTIPDPRSMIQDPPMACCDSEELL